MQEKSIENLNPPGTAEPIDGSSSIAEGRSNSVPAATLENSPLDQASNCIDSELECQQYVVGVGASAGGLEALDAMFRNMPEDTGMSFVVVQHLSPDFKSHMDQLLGRVTDIPIQVVDDGVDVKPNTIYLIPPKKEMVISNGKLLLTERSKEKVLSHPIDQFFRALSQDAGRCAVGIILSGTGSDGSRGIVEIEENDGLTIAQEPSSCRFNAMPLNAHETGKVHLVMPPEAIGKALKRYVVDGTSPKQLRQQELKAVEESGLTRVFQLLQRNHGIDFSHYKSGTVGRRIQRRMELLEINGVDQYVDHIHENPTEISDLYKDLLIGVTRFFRDNEAFELLEQTVIPELLEKSDGVLRIWVCGCATGEEAYSIAMLVTEAIEKHPDEIEFKVFATDAHRDSLKTAAAGIYSEDALKEVSTDRRKRFFHQRRGRFHVNTELRRSVVFAPQNVVSDPPFTQMNLVTCRNMLIYFQPPAQRKVLSLFHFALRNGGILFLGPSESVGEISDEFEIVDQHWKIFRKRRDVRLPVEMRMPNMGNVSATTGHLQSPLVSEANNRRQPDVLPEAYDKLLGRFMPPSVLIDSHNNVLHVFEGAREFLDVPLGRPTTNLLEMVYPGVKTSLAAAIQHSVKEGKSVRYGGLPHPTDQTNKRVRLSVEPIALQAMTEACVLVRFEVTDKTPTESKEDPQFDDVNFSQMATSRIESLEHELEMTRQNLQATIEELETSNEELQATNEEMVAANEELQSTNEELHSVNEELYTVNAEHQARVAELDEANSDMNNLLATTRVGVLYLDRDLHIRRFTPEVARLLHLEDQDLGRNVKGSLERIADDDFLPRLNRTLHEGIDQEWECEIQGAAFFARALPYKKGREMDGLVLSLVDIDGLRKAEDDARKFKFMADENVDAQMLLDESGAVTYANKKMCENLGYELAELTGLSMMRFDAEHDRSQYSDRFDLAHARGGDVFESIHIHKDKSTFPVEISITPVAFANQRFLFAAVRDITRRKEREKQLTLLSNAIEAAKNGITITDYGRDDNPITFVNEGFIEMTGFGRDEVIGRNCRFLQGDETDSEQVDKIRRAVDRGESVRTLLKNYRKDGSEFWNDLFITPVRDDNGKVTHFVGVQNDVSERIAAGELTAMNERTIRLLLDSTAEGLFGLDVDGRCTFCNETAAVALGHGSADDLVELEMHGVIQPIRDDGSEFPPEESTILQALQNGVSDNRKDEVFVRRDSSTFPVEFWVHPLKEDGQVIGAVVSFVDITERLASEQELTDARDAANAANEAKSRFLANMSHEVRTPLSAIMGFTKIIQEEHSGIEDLQEKLNTIQRNGDYLLRLLGDVLDLSRIEAGKLRTTRSSFSLEELLSDINATMQMRSEDYRCKLTFELGNPLPASITSDSARLRQVLINLIANALKFAPDGSVVVRVLNADISGERSWLTFDVIDDGIGIKPERLRTLFEPFTQADETIAKRFGGTGLGLSISKRLVTALGGKMAVESTVRKGSRFTVTIPVDPIGRLVNLELSHEPCLVQEVSNRAKSSPEEGIDLQAYVLIADDMRDVRFVAEHFLKKYGCSVAVAENGREAVDMVIAARDEGRPFDVCLMDVQMPEMDGPTAVGEMRKLGIELPIVALTADAMKGTRRRLIGAGFDEYLTKPLSVDALITVIRNLLRR